MLAKRPRPARAARRLAAGLVALSAAPSAAAYEGLAATWYHGQHSVPGYATVDGAPLHYRYFAALNASMRIESDGAEILAVDWPQDAARRIRPGARVPAVLYMHGCDGPTSLGPALREQFDAEGYAVFMPNSFAQDRRDAACEYGAQKADVNRLRNEEVEYAMERIRELPWVEPSRIVLAGNSEGGVAAASYHGDEPRGRIVLAWDCAAHGARWRGIKGPGSTPVLAVYGEDDPYHAHHDIHRFGACDRHLGARPHSRAIGIPDHGHTVAGLPVTREAITTFLRACCSSPEALAWATRPAVAGVGAETEAPERITSEEVERYLAERSDEVVRALSEFNVRERAVSAPGAAAEADFRVVACDDPLVLGVLSDGFELRCTVTLGAPGGHATAMQVRMERSRDGFRVADPDR